LQQQNIERLRDIIHSPRFVPLRKKIAEFYYDKHSDAEVEQQRELFIEELHGISGAPSELCRLLTTAEAAFSLGKVDFIKDPDYGASAIDDIESAIARLLRDNNVFFAAPEQTITSQEYWREYFRKHPEQQPSKLVYYTGGDPTAALSSWREKLGIQKKTKPEERHTMGFAEHVPNKEHLQEQVASTVHRQRFAVLALKVFAEHYNLSLSEAEERLAALRREWERP